MANIDIPMLVPQILGELFAVVLDSNYGGGARVRLAADGRSWLRSADYGGGFQPQESTWSDDNYVVWIHAPSPGDLAAAVELATKFNERRYCELCGVADLRFHMITPGVYGDPWLGCTLRPDPRIVDSYGGNGDRKHYGDSAGCRYVEPAPIYREDVRYVAAGYYLHGEPLTAIEVIKRDWCSKCTGAAHNVRERVRTKLAEELGREATERELAEQLKEREAHHLAGSLIRHILDEVGDRKQSELLIELRAGLSWQTKEEYLAMTKERGWQP